MSETLTTIRERLRAIDDQWLQLFAQRQALALQAGRAKAAAGLPLKDSTVEASTLARQRARARELGLDEETAVAITQLLIEASCRAQGD